MKMMHQGFSLIEVMIVVAIVAILSVIAVPSYSRYVEKGRMMLAKSYLNEARQEAQAEFLKTGKYPAKATDYAVFKHNEYSQHYTLTVEEGSGKNKTKNYKLSVIPTASNKFGARGAKVAILNLSTGEFEYKNCTYSSVCDSMKWSDGKTK